jgi:hypothetical protein
VSSPSASTARLRRSLFARLFTGFFLQQILTCALALELVLVVIVSTFGSAGTVLAATAPSLIFWVIWGFGVAGSAEADDTGLRWRYYAAHRYAWTEIEEIEFGGAIVRGTTGLGRPVIRVVVGGRRHPVTPAYGCSRSQLAEFGRAVSALATAHGVAVRVTAYEDAVWGRLGAA